MSSKLRKVSGNIALAAASVLVILCLLEVGVRIAGFQPIFDVYSKPSILWRRDELLGWSHEPNTQDIYLGPRPWPIEFKTLIQINSLGLRGPEIEDLPESGYRILMLGDSMVAGFEVAYEATNIGLMEEWLNRKFDFPVQVINAGVRGYGTDQSYLYYRERGRALAPDMVLFNHSPNDHLNNVTLHRMRRPFGKGAFALDETGSLQPVGYPIPEFPLCSEFRLSDAFQPVRIDTGLHQAICWIQTHLADHSALFTFLSNRIRQKPGFLRNIYKLGSPHEEAAAAPVMQAAGFLPLAALPPSPASEQTQFALTSALLVNLAREVAKDGAEFHLMMKPEPWKQLDVEALEAVGAMPLFFEGPPINPDDLHFNRDSHLNARGHHLSAKLLTRFVAERIREHQESIGP